MIDQALIERVRIGEGADREIDAAIHLVLFPDSLASKFITGALRSKSWQILPGQGFAYETENGGGGVSLPAYTTNLNAVLALIAEKLPGWSPSIAHVPEYHRNPGDPEWTAEIAGNFREVQYGWGEPAEVVYDHHNSEAASPARALLTAALTALLALNAKDDADDR
jgi:hypothetical protein